MGCELPVGFGVMFVTVFFPRGGFFGERPLAGDAAVEALIREDGEFGFGHSLPRRRPGLSHDPCLGV